MSNFKANNNESFYKSKDEYPDEQDNTPLDDPRLSALQTFIEKRNELYFDGVSKEANVDGQHFVDFFYDERMNDALFTTPIKTLEEVLSKLGIDNLKSLEFINTINAVRDAYKV